MLPTCTKPILSSIFDFWGHKRPFERETQHLSYNDTTGATFALI